MGNMKNKIIIFVSVLILISLFNLNSKTAEACSLIYRTPAESFAGADIVFTGKVVSSKLTTQEGVLTYGTNLPMKIATVEFRVDRYWKGVPTEIVTVVSSSPAGYSCPVFAPTNNGGEYLVYAKKNVSGTAYTISYSEVKEVANATQDLTFLANTPVKTMTKVNTATTTIKTPVKINIPAKQTVKPSPVPGKKDTTSVKANENANPQAVEAKTQANQNFIQRFFSWLLGN
jgi:hypothetical protein